MTPAATAYLARLGLEPGLPPTLDTLRLVHRRHLENIPYENLDIMLGRPPSVTPQDSLSRLAAGTRVGYCFHQNGSLEVLLRELGFAVERRHGHVYTAPENRWEPDLSHLILVVSGLPDPTNPAGRWWADVGLGDGFRDPLPLVAGEHDQDGWVYGLAPSTGDGWSFVHDPAGSFTGVEMTGGVVDAPAVAVAHAELSTAPEGHFTQKLVVQRRDAVGVDYLRGCLYLRVEPGRRQQTTMRTYEDWRAALVDVLRVPVDDVPEDELRALWDRTHAARLAWEEAGRP